MPSVSEWSAGAEVTLTTVSWDSAYRDIVQWRDYAHRASYIDRPDAHHITLKNAQTIDYGSQVVLDEPFSTCVKYNYIRVVNPKISKLHPDKERPTVFYYFIQDVVRVAPDVTMLSVQLDVWTTYCGNVRLRNAFVVQGHLPVAATWRGRQHDVLREAEGLDLGSDYMVRYSERYTVANLAQCCVMLVASTDFSYDPGDQANPNLRTAKGSAFEGLPNGCDIVLVRDIGTFEFFTTAMSPFPWVSQGVQMVMLLPTPDDMFDKIIASHNTDNVHDKYRQGVDPNTIKIIRSRKSGHEGDVMWGQDRTFFGGGALELLDKTHFADWQKNYTKLVTAPYLFIELTNYQGQSMAVHPEYLPNGGKVTLSRLQHFAPPGPRIVVWLRDYLSEDNTTGNPLSNSFLDGSLFFTNFPMFSIPNNSGLNALASQAHSIAFAYQSADWSQQKALQGNQVAYDQASYAIGTARQSMVASNTARGAQTALSNAARTQSTAITNDAAWGHTQNNMIQQGVSGGMGAIGSLLSGDIGGAVKGVVGTGMGIHMANSNYNIDANARDAQTDLANSTASQSTAITNNLASKLTGLQNAQAAYNRDTNKEYADMVAKGDYSNTLAGLKAKIQDTRMAQPSISGQIGGDAFMLATTGWMVDVRLKTPHRGAVQAVSEHFARFGYRCNRTIDMAAYNLTLMTHFTYWKLADCRIDAPSVPQMHAETIRGIFEKGVTVWDEPKEITEMHLFDNGPKEVVEL